MSRARVTPSSDNIFADIGVPDAESHLLKARLVTEILRLTRAEKLTQRDAGARMGITQPEVSRMFRGHFHEYSVERLMGFLTAFDREVEIVTRPRRSKDGPARITFSVQG